MPPFSDCQVVLESPLGPYGQGFRAAWLNERGDTLGVAPPGSSSMLGLVRGNSYRVVIWDGCGSIEGPLLQVPALPASCRPLRVPNIITADGDGVNDYFTLEGTDPATRYLLQIHDRWGRTIYSGDYRPDRWPGPNVKPGAYFYHLTLGEQTRRGWVEVVRP